MNQNSICQKVSALLSLYIENNLTEKEKSFVEEHLKSCNNCNNKYIYLKYLINDLKSSYKQIQELSKQKQNRLNYSIKEHEKFLNNISSFVDNELNNEDSLYMKKHLAKSQAAQKELKNLYTLKNKLQTSFNKVKKQNNKSISKSVIKLIKTRNKEHKVRQMKTIIFNPQTLKVSILIGLLFLGGYEFDQLLKINYQTKQQSIQIHSNIKNSVSRFIGYFKINP